MHKQQNTTSHSIGTAASTQNSRGGHRPHRLWRGAGAVGNATGGRGSARGLLELCEAQQPPPSDAAGVAVSAGVGALWVTHSRALQLPAGQCTAVASEAYTGTGNGLVTWRKVLSGRAWIWHSSGIAQASLGRGYGIRRATQIVASALAVDVAFGSG